MVIECWVCESVVAAKVLQTHESGNTDFYSAPYRTTFLECPRCETTMVAAEEALGIDGKGELVWGPAVRVYPLPDRSIASSVPGIVRNSLEEANLCFRARAYSACAVMCGRALEGMCRHFNTKSKYLGEGLKELKQREIVDQRLSQWSEELQRHRNLGAHATEERIPREDAQDLLDFANAITEYVFVLADRFEKFMTRRKSGGPEPVG